MTDSLLSRLSALTEPSSEIDAEIALANGWTHQKMKGDARPYWRRPGETTYYMREEGPPRYTASIDAALTLKPPNLAIERLSIWPGLPAEATSLGTHVGEDGTLWHERKDGRWEAQATTPAIALLIAIMRAKEESKP